MLIPASEGKLGCQVIDDPTTEGTERRDTGKREASLLSLPVTRSYNCKESKTDFSILF